MCTLCSGHVETGKADTNHLHALDNPIDRNSCNCLVVVELAKFRLIAILCIMCHVGQ